MLVACQSAGSGSLPPAGAAPSNAASPSLVPDSAVLEVAQTQKAGEVVLRFQPGISAATAAAAGRHYGLELTGGTLLSGPTAPGRFIFQIPQVTVEPLTPTTAIVIFPNVTRSSDRRAYLADHNLRVLRWARAIDDVVTARVGLPAAQLNPLLVDPIAGLFQVSLSAGLDQASVSDWAASQLMRLLTYDPSSGVTVVHPTAWRSVLQPPMISYAQPVRQSHIAPSPAPAGTLYVQFATEVTKGTITALVNTYGLGLVSVGATNLAILSGDPSSTRAAIQLLSDRADVQCVGTSPNPCAASSTPGGGSATAPAPTYTQPSAVVVQVVDGMLMVTWQPSAGATAYAIFRSPTHAGPFELVGIVAGQGATSYTAWDQAAPGASVYYEVVALHPCTQPAGGETCDVAVVPFAGPGTAASVWTNPVPAPAPVVQAPAAPAMGPSPSPAVAAPVAPSASPSPSPAVAAPVALSASPSPSPTVAAPAAPSASPSPSPPVAAPVAPAASPGPAANTNAPAQASPSPTPAGTVTPGPSPTPQPPAQTQSGPLPLSAPAGISAAAAEGHATVTWQSVPGASAYRVYRSSAGGPAIYLAVTTELAFTDTGGSVASTYSYEVAAVAASGLVGRLSLAASVTWRGSAAAPVVLRSLPAQTEVLSGSVRLQVDARSADGRGQVEWRLSGPAANVTIGSATGQPIATAPLSWSAELAWDSSAVVDGTYSLSAVVKSSSGAQTTVSSTYRIQNAGPIAPVNLTALSEQSGVALTWQQAASATGAYYRLSRDVSTGGTPLVEISADRRSFVDTTAQAGSHRYDIVLVDAHGRTSQAVSAQVVVAAPSIADNQPRPDLQVLLPSGQALAPDGRVSDRIVLVAPDLSGLTIELSSDGRSWSALGKPPTCAQDACSLALEMDHLAPGPYTLRAITPRAIGPAHTFVRAGASRYSPPNAVSADVTGLGVQLSWTAPVAALPASYRVSRRIGAGEWQLLDQVAATFYVDASAPPGATVAYRVSAVDPEGVVGAPSVEVTVSVPLTELAELQAYAMPPSPTDIAVTAAHGRATVRWEGAAGADGYLVEHQIEPGAAFAVAGETAEESFVDAPALQAAAMSYRVISLRGIVWADASSAATVLVVPTAPPLTFVHSTASSDRPAPPTNLTATIQSGSVHLTWNGDAVTAPSSVFSLYRLDPNNGVFALAASGLEVPSFMDSALPWPARFGYVVTVTSPDGVESLFSSPVWVPLESGSGTFSVELMAPTPTDASLVESSSLSAVVKITAADLDQVSFALAHAGGWWTDLPARPVDPGTPAPGPGIGAAPSALWGTMLNTTSLASGSYRLRVQVSDRSGQSREQFRDVYIVGAAARGPPSFALNASAIPGGVHLQWNDANIGGFLVQRSLFGPDGPFETIANVQAEQYDDISGIPRQAYSYQVVQLGATVSTSFGATSASLPAPPDAGGPSVALGLVSQTEISTTVSSVASIHPLSSGMQPLGSTYDFNATSLATRQPVHHLGEEAKVTFQLPAGLPSDAAESASIYHWDETRFAWVKEDSIVDPTLTSVAATITHLSEFVVAWIQPPTPSGSVAQQPAPPIDPSASQSGDPYQVGPDGEVISMRTATSRTYRNTDGSFREVITAGLVNFKDANGRWQKIDTTLVPESGNAYVRNAAGPLQLELPGDASGSPVVVSSASGTTTFSLEGAAHSARTISGSQASYADIVNGVSASYSILPEGLKENLVISSRPAHPQVFTFDLTTGDLVLSELPNSSIEAVDPSGKVQYTINAPWMHDAATPLSPEGATSASVGVTLTGGSGHYRMTYTPNAAWLDDPARRYPVTLDPSLTYSYAYGGEWDDQINTCSPDYNYHAYTYLPIGSTPFNMGSYWCYGPSRAMITFGSPSVVPSLAYYAQLNLVQYVNTNGGGSPIYAEPAAGGWSFTGVTWNNQPGANCTYGCPVAYTVGASAPAWVSWNVTQTIQAWQTGQYPQNGFVMVGNENGCNPYCDEEFFASDNYSTAAWRPQLSIYWYDESGTIAWSSPAHTITATGGSLVSVPITVTNTANQVGGSLTWHAYNQTDMVRVGIRDYRSTSGAIIPMSNAPNLRTYLPSDVAPGGSTSLNAVVQVPGDPGDYLLRLDLVHETLTSTTWFYDRNNKPLEVRVRVVAPGDGKSSQVPVPLGDGSSLGVSTSNGFATLSATDFNIPERAGASLRLSRAYNGVNAFVPGVGTAATSSTYGLGWTFNFQRSVHLGSLGPNTYDPSSGILTDAAGQAWTLSWNAGRGLYEDAAGNRTLAPSTAIVTTSGTNTVVVPTRPVDLINGTGMVVSDGTAPGGYALRLDTSSPATALILPPGLVPVQQNGSIEFWFEPNFSMTATAGCHVFFSDAQMRFGLAWNCTGQSWGGATQVMDFFTYDGDTGGYDILPSAPIAWTGGWHHISLTWSEGGAKQLMTDTALVTHPAHAESPVADLIFGYEANASSGALNYLNGRITQLRIDGRVVPGNATSGELFNDAQAGVTLTANQNTLYLGQYTNSSPQSVAATYQLRNADQSTDTYSSAGVLQNESDRMGNQIDYTWDSSGRIQTISDHSIGGRTITFAYSGTTITATDLAGRTITYQLNAVGDLISVTRSNQIPDPRTGVMTAQNATTSYSYAAGHLMQQVTDPRGATTALNYDQKYRQAILADAPIAYWRLGETNGQAADSSGGGHPSTIANAVAYSVGGALTGDSDTALGFNGTSSYVSVPYAAGLVPTFAFSLEIWLKTGSNPGLIAVLLDDENGAFAKGAKLNYDATGHANFQLDPTYSITSGVLSLNTWHHVVGTYDGTYQRLYVDGVLAAGPTANPYIPNDGGAITVGAITNGTSNFWNGKLDEAAIYPAALTAARIQAHFAAGRLGIGASPSGYAANVVYDSPAAYWRMGESTGTRAFDQSGGGNNGTYSGGFALGQSGALATDSATAVGLDGSSGFVALADNPTLYGTALVTVEVWVKANAWVPGGSIFNRRTTGNVGGWDIDVASTSGQIVFYVYVAGSWRSTTTANGLVAGAWHHLVGTYDGSNLQVYADGVLGASTAFAGSANNPSGPAVWIGRNIVSTYYFNGLIQEAAEYGYALSGARVVAHYNAGRAAPLSGYPYPNAVTSDRPIGYWRLGETAAVAGSQASDSSGSGNPGTYVGGFTPGQGGAIANDSNHSVRFNGTTGYVSLGNPAAFQITTATVEAWVSTTATTQSAIVAKNSAWWLGVLNGQLQFYDWVGGWHDSGVTINDGSWHQIAAIFVSGQAGGSQMYVDGKPAGGAFQITISSQSAEVETAALGGTTQYLNGVVGDVSIYPTVLSARRILSHYQASRLSPVQPTGSSLGTYEALVAADRPVGNWRLDEPAGTAALDRSGFDNPGTYGGNLTLGHGAGPLPTEVDPAASFDGISGNVSIPGSASLNVAGPMTIEAWFYPRSSAIAPIVEYNNGTTLGVHLWNWPNPDEIWINFYDTAGTSHGIQSPAGQISLNQWHHVVATYDGANGSLYINGVLVGRSYLGSFSPNTNLNLNIAKRPSGSPQYFLNGSVGDVAIYNYALTASRVLAHYNAGWDYSQHRVMSVQDGRANTIAGFSYNDDLATTQVLDGRGLPAYYTYQSNGGRTVVNTDTGNNQTSYQYDPSAPYRLVASSSPTVLQQYTTMNTTGPVGQQEQVLIQDVSGQPRPSSSFLMSGGYPDPSVYGSSSLYTTGESWIWDSAVTIQPGVLSHRSTPMGGTHQHYLQFSNSVLVPAGSTLSQWIYLEPGVQPPAELEIQLLATDGTGWGHRAAWGPTGLFGGFGCPSACQQGSSLPVAGRWAQLNINLGPTEGASPQFDVDMAGRYMVGIAFTLYGGGGAVWWGPTMFTFPGGAVTDPSRVIARNAYNSTNDLIASVDPNGIAAVKDLAGGLTYAASSGVESATPAGLFQDNVSAIGVLAWQQEFGYPGTSAATVTSPQHNGVGSLTQTHGGAGLQSDLYKDVTGLTPGTYVRVSVWVQSTAGATGQGGASLMVENHLTGALNIQRRSANLQTSGQWMQLTMPFVVDGSGQLRIHLWQENFQGTTTWADLHIDDLTPAPDATLQHPLGIFATGFEVQPDSSWSLGTAAALNDASQSHTGSYSMKDTLGANNTSNTVSRSFTSLASAAYRVNAWVRTVVSGGHGGAGGAQLCAVFTTTVCSPSATTYTTTEGGWQQLSVSLSPGSGTLTVQLKHVNWQGDVYWDDVNVERVADSTPATSGTWRGTGWTGATANGASATWTSSWTGGLGGGPSRQVTVATPGATTDISDALATGALRTGASYVFSVWAGSTAGTSITLGVAGQTMDVTTPCTLQATPTLCQNSFTYGGADKAQTNTFIYYGGQGARTVVVSHPLIALASQVFDYTTYGQQWRSRDIFGRATSTTFDASSLYTTQGVVTAAPSPNLTTSYTYNALGQLILSTRVNGAQSIAEQFWLDSWGRQVGDVKDCGGAVAPPTVCTGTADAATNVMTRYVYDLNGNLTDQFDQARVSGSWFDTHYLYDADNNQVGKIQDCVTVTNPCDGATSASQNVVTAFGFDASNRALDTFAPMPGCAANCVPAPICTTLCLPPAVPCPTATCTDAHTVYDVTGRVYQQIRNYNGTQDVSQANVTTQFVYDLDGRVLDTFTPITSAAGQTGQIDERKGYDILGRLVSDIKANTIPGWMQTTTAARTDYTLDAGGRVISVTGPGTGSASATNRIVTTTDFDDLGRPLYVTVDSGNMNATTRTVYDPRGSLHTWTPATRLLTAGVETSTNSDIAGHVTSVVRDDGSGGFHLTSSTNYDGYGRATDVVDPRGIDTNTVYDALDRTTAITSNYCPSGNTNPNCTGSGILPDQNLTTSYVLDLAGNKIEVVNPRGIMQYTAYDELARTILVTKSCQTVPAPPSTICGTQSSDQNVSSSQTYDQLGNVITTTDPIGRINVIGYDALGRKVSSTQNYCPSGTTNPNCHGSGPLPDQNLVTTWQMDAQGDVLQERSPRQCTASMPCYQGATGTSVTDGTYLSTGYAYDGMLRLGSVTEDQAHLALTTRYTYDPSGHKLSQTDGRGFATSYAIDNLGRVTRVTDAGGNVVQTYYSLAGEVIGSFDARQQRNTYAACTMQPNETGCNTLDRVGRTTGVSYLRSDGATQVAQSLAYDADGNRTSYSDSDVAQTTVTYDHLNRVSTVTATSPLGTTSYNYFLDGAKNTITDANGTTTFTEDRLGRTATMVDPLNPSTNSPTSYTYDAAGRLTSRAESSPSGGSSSWAYVQSGNGADSNQGAVTVALGAATSTGDTLVVVAVAQDGIDGIVPTVSSISDNGAAHATYGVAVNINDAYYQDLEIWYATNIPAGITSVTVAFSGAFQGWYGEINAWVGEYSGLAASGALDKTASSYNSTSSSNAPTGTTLATTAANELVIGAVFEASTSTLTSPAGWTQRWNTSPDTYGSLSAAVANVNGAAQAAYQGMFTVSPANSTLGAIATFKPAGGGGSSGGVVTTMTYTGTDHLASKTEVSGTTTLASWTNVTYDFAQNRTAETLTYYAANPYPDQQAGTSTYQYDSLNQLSQASIPNKPTATYGFDAAHNLTSNAGVTQAYNNNESLQTVGTATVGSDPDGNQQKDLTAPTANILSWNSLSQLEQFGTAETYTYDALGRLTKVTNGANVTQFVYRGVSGEVVDELNASGGVIRAYAWDAPGNQIYVSVSGTVSYQITDPHGDVVALASPTALVGTTHFDAWGNVLGSSGAAAPFGFQGDMGSWTDTTSGFVSMGVRWYYPKVGRFLSSDTAAGTADARTPMAGLRWIYGLDNPLDQSDPTGLRVCDVDGYCFVPTRAPAPTQTPPPTTTPTPSRCPRCGGPRHHVVDEPPLLLPDTPPGFDDTVDQFQKAAERRQQRLESKLLQDELRSDARAADVADAGAAYDDRVPYVKNGNVYYRHRPGSLSRVAGSIDAYDSAQATESSDTESLARTGRVASALKWASRGLFVVGVVVDEYNQWSDDSTNPNLTTAQRAGRVAVAGALETVGAVVGATVGAAVGEAVGGVVGGVAGATVGATLGLACGPLAEICSPLLAVAGESIGSAAGAFVGGVVGGAIGGWIGGQAGKAVKNKVFSMFSGIFGH